ncbi:MAG TPA: hypothetical protein VGB24_18310 [Longimicrobium sp.]|jgi:hypothetical protein|uniref:hypothetical protein n=1 Tax=Longimicrobium sp. TaxID=2029185 RepID=UPI002EDA673C
MMRQWTTVASLAALMLAAPAAAQVTTDTVRAPRTVGSTQIQGTATRTGRTPAATARTGQLGTPHYDVVLEVPELSVDSLGLTVAGLQAHLSLNANAASLVSLTAGADVSIDRVELQIMGVLAQVYLYIDLDNVTRIVDRVLATLERNPQLFTQLLSTVDNTVNTVGGVANTALQPGGVVGQIGGQAQPAQPARPRP